MSNTNSSTITLGTHNIAYSTQDIYSNTRWDTNYTFSNIVPISYSITNIDTSSNHYVSGYYDAVCAERDDDLEVLWEKGKEAA